MRPSSGLENPLAEPPAARPVSTWPYGKRVRDRHMLARFSVLCRVGWVWRGGEDERCL